MVVQALKPSEHAQTALDLLAEADADIVAGKYDSVSGKLWSAVEHAVMAVAANRGWECEGDGYLGLRPVVRQLGEEADDERLGRGFDGVSIFHDNMKYTFLEDYEVEFFSPSVHRFVSNVIGHLN